MKFVIPAASYDVDVGGIIVVHKLCHLLNELGFEAYLYPVLVNDKVLARRLFARTSNAIPAIKRLTGKGFVTNPEFNTPLLSIGSATKKPGTIAIYSETIEGNPLAVQHIVRWFLHRPGFHTGKSEFGTGEFHVDFNEFLNGYDPGENFLAPESLMVVHFPIDIYNLDGAIPQSERTEIAYCVRKGELKPGVIDPETAICIDGLSHTECAKVLKRSKLFVSFDPYTAYSSFAALCGASSLVVPPEGMTRADWYQDEGASFGIAFGEDDLERANATRERVLPYLLEKEARSRDRVASFAAQAGKYFSLVSNAQA